MSAVSKAGNDNDNINDNDETTINLKAKAKDEIEGNEQNGEFHQNNKNNCNLTANNLLPTFSIICRICHNNDLPERLISPCICKGTLAYVHRSCLELWLSRSATRHCELCLYHYRFTEILRYNWWEALRIWYRNSHNRKMLQSDILICTLLTIVTFGLVAISVTALQFFVVHENESILPSFFPKQWTEGTLIVFLIIVLFAYFLNMYVIIKSHCVPWYGWWQSIKFVVLVIDDHRFSQHESNSSIV